MAGWAIDIDRADINAATIVDPDVPEIGAGQILVAIEDYAMTANNITYAVFGEPAGLFGNDQGYWDFFSERGEPGRLPVWGFGTVVDSKSDGIAPGDRYYGYWPMASHCLLNPSDIGPMGFTDATPRRTTLPPIYNSYQKVDSIPDYRAEHHDYWPVFRPLFLTGWLIADQYADDGDYGVAQVIVASASSKTAIGTGFAHRKREGDKPRCIGLTSRSNVEALAGTGIYDQVLAYDDLETLDASLPTGFVDIAGNGTLTQAIHAHFGDNLSHSMVVGKSHWDAPSAEGLAGPAQEGFFAPGRAQKRIADWGPQGFGERMAAGWLAFMEIAPDLLTIERRTGAEAALEAYRTTLAGDADPTVGILVAP
ncbi:DUF2855 family protein [uncultured Parasphingopyxis sp.]|uniref:DUF2855 family protein n=1 Tax=uncultured Parasphingopyxis sp. TaxID=1547918 RepID=UPI002613154E|nr:DUF2855 family protein [uncultured Parasphingopyxis sp.]